MAYLLCKIDWHRYCERKMLIKTRSCHKEWRGWMLPGYFSKKPVTYMKKQAN